MGEKLLEVKNLTIGFPTDSGMHTVVDDVSFTMQLRRDCRHCR